MDPLPITLPYLARENEAQKLALSRMRRSVHDVLIAILLLAVVLMSGAPPRASASVAAPAFTEPATGLAWVAEKRVDYAASPQVAPRPGVN